MFPPWSLNIPSVLWGPDIFSVYLFGICLLKKANVCFCCLLPGTLQVNQHCVKNYKQPLLNINLLREALAHFTDKEAKAQRDNCIRPDSWCEWEKWYLKPASMTGEHVLNFLRILVQVSWWWTFSKDGQDFIWALKSGSYYCIRGEMAWESQSRQEGSWRVKGISKRCRRGRIGWALMPHWG